MIVIEELSYKNFLAVGAKPVTIKFNETSATLVTGTNGAGKSTFLDALNFVFFNKPFRKLKKRIQLVNAINKKDMVVEVKFTGDGRPYRVVRGIKPDRFEIYCDGKLVNQEAANRDYQKDLETQILKLNRKTFNKVVILGSASYIPFMQLKAEDRRDIIEDIMDIKIFSAMSKVLKGKMDETTQELSTTKVELDLCSTKIESQKRVVGMSTQRVSDLGDTKKNLQSSRDTLLAEREAARLSAIADINSQLERNAAKRSEYVSSFTKERDERLRQYDDEEVVLSGDIVKVDSDVALLESEVASLRESLKKYEKSEAALVQARKLQTQTNTKIESLEEQASFFRDNETCPSCSQPITEDHKHGVLEKYDLSIGEKRTTLESVDAALKHLESEVSARNELQKRLVKVSGDKTLAEGQLTALTSRRATVAGLREKESSKSTASTASYDEEESRLLAKRTTLELQTVSVDDLAEKIQAADLQLIAAVSAEKSEQVKLNQMETKHEEVTAKYSELLERRKIEDAAKALLKDDGIKTAVIKEYLPAINKLINTFLAAMDFYVSFELDESFDEVIKSRGRDEFSYDSFSEGEKRRIDLAILFTWRRIAQMKNSVNVKVMILDEILDGSLDAIGIDHFMKMMNEFGEDTNIFVISHRDIVDGFESYLRFEKRDDFSVMVEQ